MMEAAIEAGADDCETDEAAEDQWDEYEPVHTIWTARDDLGDVSAALNEKFGDAKSVNLVWKGQNDIDNPTVAAQVVRLQDALEDLDDVNNVYHNFDMTEEAAATLESE
jgi:transcriptional/translational regulatory protein YebC/TACO1